MIIRFDMEYEVTILNVNDADAIVINYHDGTRWWTAVVDAGNVGDGAKVKKQIKHQESGMYVIDYAFCTHPDKDHKGGFFDLLQDSTVAIRAFFIRRPDLAVRNNSRELQYGTGVLEAAAKAVYNHPQNDRLNLIDFAARNGCLYEPVIGVDLKGMPLMMIGPRDSFFRDACYEMALNFAELEDEASFESYAEDELPSDNDAQSVMDEVKEESATNKSSLILLFHPNGRNFLLAGDACSASLHDAIDDYPNGIPGCVLKVPHHGSKHNLTTEVIDLIKPSSAAISCKGSKKHPNPAVVHFLSKYCNVYSTHKCGENGWLTYQSAPVNNPATPIRKKQ